MTNKNDPDGDHDLKIIALALLIAFLFGWFVAWRLHALQPTISRFMGSLL